MKRRIIILAVLICAAFLITIAVQYTTHAQESTEQEEGQSERPGTGRRERPGGGGRTGGRMDPGQIVARMLPMEASWAYISFEMDMTGESLGKAWIIYKEAWKDRKGMTKKMTEAAGDRTVMRDIRTMAEDTRAELATKLKDAWWPAKIGHIGILLI
ncbi:hypothetical protein ACFL6S_36385 [Candidatus Poribacteria bacterium]